MLADDCRTLSNCASFLRMFGDHGAGVPEQALVPNWVAASHALLGVMNENAFMACLPSDQAVANLISFVKRCDRHLQQSPPAGRTTTTTMPARLTIGVNKDLNQASQWFRKAVNQGYIQAKAFLN